MKIGFKQFLKEAKSQDHTRPYIKASDAFKDTIKKLKGTTSFNEVKKNLLFFSKNVKSDGKIPGGLHEHPYTSPLNEYIGVHLQFGQYVLLYVMYRSAILYIDILQKKSIEGDNSAKRQNPRLDDITRKLKTQVDKTFEKFKRDRR